VENYQTIPNNPGNVNMQTVVGPAATADGHPVGAALNLADDPALVPGRLWGPPAQQTNNTNRPTLRVVHGKSVLEFNPAGNTAQTMLVLPDATNWASALGTTLNTNQQSWFVVYRPSTLTQTGTMLRTLRLNNVANGILDLSVTNGNVVVGLDPAGNSSFQTLTTPASTTDYAILSVIWNGGTLSAFNNGSSIGTLTGLSGSSSLNRFRIGGNQASATGAFSGDIAAVLAYSAALNTADRQAVEDYLATNVLPIPEPTALVLAILGMALAATSRNPARR